MSRSAESETEDPYHVHLYSILNVSRVATAADLKAAYRRLSQLYHPDKHSDPQTKDSATENFTRIKEAYEILSDAKLRKIYDEFGLEAVRKASAPGLEVATYDELRQRFKEGDGEGGGRGFEEGRFGADARFKVTNGVQAQVDGTGLVAALEYGFDALQAANIPVAVLTQTMLSSRASLYVSQRDTVEVNYLVAANHVQSSRAKALGKLAVVGRHQFSTEMNAEVGVDLSRPGLVGKIYRALSDDSAAALEILHPLGNEEGTTMAISAERALSSRNQASIKWAAGFQPSVSFTIARRSYNEMLGNDSEGGEEATEDATSNGFDPDVVSFSEEERKRKGIVPIALLVRGVRPLAYIVSSNLWRPVGARCTFTLSPFDTSISGSLKRPIGENAPWFGRSQPQMGGAHIGVRGSLSRTNWDIELEGGQRFFEADAFWTLTVAVGSNGVILRLNIGRSGHTLSIPVVLSSPVADPKVATVAAISSSLIVASIQSFVIKPWQAKIEAREREMAKNARQEEMRAAKEGAEASRKLMQKAVESSLIRERKVASGGLIVERALYGRREPVLSAHLNSESFGGREVEMEVIEVGDCIQALVEDSRVQIITNNKSTLMGFWDPTALGDDKVLRIWYRFRKSLHECIVEEREPLELPQKIHKVKR